LRLRAPLAVFESALLGARSFHSDLAHWCAHPVAARSEGDPRRARHLRAVLDLRALAAKEVMASLFTHVAVPLIGRRAIDVDEKLERRLAIVAVLLSIWPDLDYATLPFEVRPNDLLGHRGLTHSIFVALMVGLVASLLFPKTTRKRMA